MIDYIGSDAVKRYYEENRIVLSDRMISARICNAGFSVGEVHNALQEIWAMTEDEDLKEQIDEYIRREKAMYEKMEKSVPGDFYRLSVWYKRDDEYSVEGYFSEFEGAILMAQAMRDNENDAGEYEKYRIEKYHAMDRSQIPLMEKYWSMRNGEGYAEYDSEGKLSDIWASLEEEKDWRNLFTDEYFYYPHPFKRGDILVRHGDAETLYIMEMNPEEEAERKSRMTLYGDVTDIGISATMISRRTGRIWDMDEWINPFEFEYAHINEKTEDVIEQAALQMQHILRRKTGSFQYIYDACVRRQEEYLESSRISLITGIDLRPHNVFF